MSYVRKVITSEEKLLAIFRPHWIYFIEGLIWFAALFLAGQIADYYLYQYFGSHAYTFNVDLWIVQFDERNTPIPWLFSLTGLALFLPVFLTYIATEVGLTDQRIIKKRGLIFVEIDQIDLEDIRAEHVHHGWFGWLLGYGRIRLDCRFIHDVRLPAIRRPYRLIKASHKARMKHPDIEYDHDEFQANIEQIDRRRREAEMKNKLTKLKIATLTSFRKIA